MALVSIHPELDSGPNAAGSDGDGTGWTWKNATKVSDPHCPKLDYVVDRVSKEQECGSIIFCDVIAVHRWLLMLLVEAGVPESRIAILNGDRAKDPAMRQQIADRFNGVPAVVGTDGTIEQAEIPPDYDIVIANAIAYEGIDLHVRTCRVYHLDLPWEPATLQQRNGRAVRQGNSRSVVEIKYLLSERSLDPVRLSMITGKLGWMKDLLQSADRETNNPAAGSDLTGEEMVLMLARDPEEARAAIAAQKELLAEESRRRVREQAWSSLRGMVTRTALLGKIADAAERGVIEAELHAQENRLRAIPADVWDWHFLIELAKAGRPLLLGSGWALPSDHYVISEEELFATGRVSGYSIGIRRFGSARFEQREPQDVKTTVAAAVRNGPSEWNRERDAAGFEAELVELMTLPNGRLQDLKLDMASAEWRAYLWGRWPEIKEGVRRAGKNLEFGLPNLSAGMLTLVEADGVDLATNLIPWTDAGFGAFLRAAPEAGIRYSDLNETSLAWWGRPFPRGLLKTRTPTEPIEVVTKQGKNRVLPLVLDGHLAVINATDQDPTEAQRWTLIHVPSGRAAAKQFHTEQAAELALRYANGMGIDWSANPPDLKDKQKHYSAAMAHIRETGQSPSAEQTTEWARAN